jgi:hypothetical protein
MRLVGYSLRCLGPAESGSPLKDVWFSKPLPNANCGNLSIRGSTEKRSAKAKLSASAAWFQFQRII